MIEDLEFYSKEETRRILERDKNLYFADDGMDEVIIKFKDIPDFIVDVNRRIGSRDLKFYKVGKTEYGPQITTIGIFLDRIRLDLRRKLINRLMKLQLNEIQPKKYKVIDELLYDEYMEEQQSNNDDTDTDEPCVRRIVVIEILDGDNDEK